MSFTLQVGPVLAARLKSMSCSYWSSQASSRKGLSCMRAPRRKSWLLLLILRDGAGMIYWFTDDENPAPEPQDPRLENHLLMLDFPKARLGSLGFGVCGSFAKCALASTFQLPLDPVPHNVLSGVEESRSTGKADGRSLRWLDYVPCA